MTRLLLALALLLAGCHEIPTRADIQLYDIAGCRLACAPHDWSYSDSLVGGGCTCFGYAAHDAGSAVAR